MALENHTSVLNDQEHGRVAQRPETAQPCRAGQDDATTGSMGVAIEMIADLEELVRSEPVMWRGLVARCGGWAGFLRSIDLGRPNV